MRALSSFLALSFLISAHLSAQTCELERATPLTCLTLEYVRALGAMAIAEEAGKREAQSSADKFENAFYAIKTRMNAERLIRQQLITYRASRDTETVKAAQYADKTFRAFYIWDSTAQADLRRIVAFKSSVGEMQEIQADQKVHADESLKYLMAVAGELLDGADIIEGPGPVTKRRMTIRQRDRIVGEIERQFANHLSVESDGNWYSGWAAVAAEIRRSLLQKGWQYLP